MLKSWKTNSEKWNVEESIERCDVTQRPNRHRENMTAGRPEVGTGKSKWAEKTGLLQIEKSRKPKSENFKIAKVANRGHIATNNRSKHQSNTQRHDEDQQKPRMNVVCCVRPPDMFLGFDKNPPMSLERSPIRLRPRVGIRPTSEVEVAPRIWF